MYWLISAIWQIVVRMIAIVMQKVLCFIKATIYTIFLKGSNRTSVLYYLVRRRSVAVANYLPDDYAISTVSSLQLVRRANDANFTIFRMSLFKRGENACVRVSVLVSIWVSKCVCVCACVCVCLCVCERERERERVGNETSSDFYGPQ